MDVFFNLSDGNVFCMEVGYWDTVLEIKEKVEKYKNIPFYKQKLTLNGQVLKDTDTPWNVKILHHSRIHVEIVDSPTSSTGSN